MKNKYAAKLRNEPDFDEFENGDLKVLEDMVWVDAAFLVWRDAVKIQDPTQRQIHSLKWSGMFSAKALDSIAEDSRTLKTLTKWLILWTVVLAFLTVILAVGEILRWCGK